MRFLDANRVPLRSKTLGIPEPAHPAFLYDFLENTVRKQILISSHSDHLSTYCKSCSNAHPHFFLSISFPAQAINLRPTRDTGFYIVAAGVVDNFPVEQLIMGHGMGSRPHE
jgi:hypothetical protein